MKALKSKKAIELFSNEEATRKTMDFLNNGYPNDHPKSKITFTNKDGNKETIQLVEVKSVSVI